MAALHIRGGEAGNKEMVKAQNGGVSGMTKA